MKCLGNGLDLLSDSQLPTYIANNLLKQINFTRVNKFIFKLFRTKCLADESEPVASKADSKDADQTDEISSDASMKGESNHMSLNYTSLYLTFLPTTDYSTISLKQIQI